MDMVFSLALVVHFIVAIALIGLVLVQHGKGADMGAAFGSGSSGSLFGASGSANFLSRTTAVLATVFFLTSLTLAYVAAAKPKATGSVIQDAVQSQPASVPAPAGDAVSSAPTGPGSKSQDIPK